MATEAQSSGVVQGPTPEEWERMKEHIYRAYLVESRPLKVLVTEMEANFGFRASKKMYNTYFAKWEPRFNKNKRRGEEPSHRQVVEIPRTRPRHLQRNYQGPTRYHPNRPIQPHSIIEPRLSNQDTKQMAVIDSTGIYVHGLFDTFNFSHNIFDIIVPDGLRDNSSVWQQIADESFGATTLMLNGHSDEGLQTFKILSERLNGVLRDNDCSMIIRFWSICIRLHKAATQLGDFSILGSFLRFCRDLAAARYPKSHPVPNLLKTLCQIPVGKLFDIFERGYLRTIACLQDRLGPENAIVLWTWSNYSKICSRQALSTDVLLSRYRRVVLREAQQAFTSHGTRTIEILHGYTYAAYYNAGNLALTRDLATELVNSVEHIRRTDESPTWCLVTQGYALAVKLLFIIAESAGDYDQGVLILQSAISKLRRGDRECQTRAIMLDGILADYEKRASTRP